MSEEPRESVVDVAICGAGPVGSAFALFLHERGMDPSRIALVDARTRDAAAADDRMIAISNGSATLLERLGAWAAIEPRATPIHTIHVSHRGRFGRTVIDRDDYGVVALGHVVRYGDLSNALDATLSDRGFVVRRPWKVAGVAHGVAPDDRLRLTSVARPDVAIDARHVVHAEGGLFDAQHRRAIHRDYGQTAVTAFVTTVGPVPEALRSTAYERFTEDGPIALLPATSVGPDGRQRHGYSLVWCGKPADSAARIALSDGAFVDALHVAFGDRLGRFAAVGPRRSFPLGLNAVDEIARAYGPRSAEFAIGNAAQALHPVAGQGLNLGLRDAHDLAASLAAFVSQRCDLADAAGLVARHKADRRVDRATTVGLTDLMPRLFASRLAPVAIGRGLTLALLDAARPLRGLFARQMMNGHR
jgi:2-octaprenyl-6-methoxyphenol hydroxylase